MDELNEALIPTDYKEVPPKGHYETIREYTKECPIYDENGNQTGTETVVVGKDVKWIWTDESEIKQERIRQLRTLLEESDYKAIKYAEGEITEEEYAPIKAQRKAWREEINRLEMSV